MKTIILLFLHLLFSSSLRVQSPVVEWKAFEDYHYGEIGQFIKSDSEDRIYKASNVGAIVRYTTSGGTVWTLP